MTFYNPATICKNGHVISSTDSNYTPFCKKCGKESTSTCQNCNRQIRGAFENDFFLEEGYQAPFYCFNCGKPFPWTELVINNAVELIALDDNLPIEHKEIIKSALPDLLVESPTTPLAVAKYKKYIPAAQNFIKDGLKNLIIDVASETVKKSLWG